MTTLALISPADPDTGARVDVRVCSSQDRDVTGAGGQRWWPAIVSQPSLQLSLFDGDFTSAVEPGSATLQVRLDVLRRGFPGVARYDWAGAKATLYRFVPSGLERLAKMKVERFASEDFGLSLSLVIDDEPFQADVLFNSYAGTTGAEGGADLKGQVKPWVFGRALNVEPVFIDKIDNVFQVSGYGPVQAISAVYERGASFGASIGNFASYAALVAADIPEGRWGTCLAEGMFRLGAPPAGVITCDVDGDNASGFLRRTGAIIKEIGRRLSLGDHINAASLDALDAAVPRNVNIVISEQESFLDLARRLVAPCNAVAGLAYDGRLVAPRVSLGSAGMVLDSQGRQMPPVLGMARENTSPPYKRIQMGAARSWRVHSFDEIAFYSEIIDKGLYNPATVYREGNIVSSVDKTRWIYINPTPASGNAPPTWPTTSNVYWSSIEGPASADPAVANTNVAIQGLLEELPITGNFIGQLFVSTDTGEQFRWDGAGWNLVADITAATQITFSDPAPFAIQANSAGITTTDLSLVSRSITSFRGGVAKSSGVTLGAVTASPASAITASASVTDGIVTVTLSKADAAGTVTVPIIIGGITYQRTVIVNRNVAAPISGGGAGSSSFTDTIWISINSTTPTQVTDTGAIVKSNASGELSFSFSTSYEGTTTLRARAQYSLDGTTWTDAGASEAVGSIPINTPGEEEPGFLSDGFVQTGLTANTDYYVRLRCWRALGTGTISFGSPNFNVSQP